MFILSLDSFQVYIYIYVAVTSDNLACEIMTLIKLMVGYKSRIMVIKSYSQHQSFSSLLLIKNTKGVFRSHPKILHPITSNV